MAERTATSEGSATSECVGRVMAVPRRTLLTSIVALVGSALVTACSRTVDGVGQAGSSSSASRPATPTGTPLPTAVDSPSAPTQPAVAGVLTVLVIGSDTRNESSFSGLSDAIVIAQLNPAANHVNLVSIARDSYVNGAKINASYSRGGPDKLRRVVSELLGGLPINATVETTFERFTRGVDLLGGLDVHNQHASNSFGTNFQAGSIHLNGADALNFVRERKGLPLGDFDRTERHRATLTGMLDRLHALNRADASQLAGLVPQLYSKVRATDLTLEQAVSMLPLLANLSATTVTSLMAPVARFASRGGASVVLIDAPQTAELGAALRTADLSGYVAKYGTTTTAIH